MTNDDLQLGMGSAITRRDFLNGVAVGVGAAAAGSLSPDFATLLAQGQADAYPPALTGLRGSHAGSFEVFHAMKDGAFWKTAPPPQVTGEEYDLVVVGAGISGLAAAHYFRTARPEARILLLDNHDDFGGHAKRNEFTHNGRTYLGYGGTQSIDSPAPFSAVSKALVTELGIDMARYNKVLDSGLYKSLGLRSAVFFDKETYGADRLVTGDVRDEAFQAAAPLGDTVRRDLKRLLTERFDPMPGLSSTEKKARLARMSYTDFLTKLWKLDAGVPRLYQTRTHGLFGVGVDAVPAQDAFGLGLPGFAGMGLDDQPGPGQNYDSIRSEEAQNYYFHFPDGNATVARLLVRRLIPTALPGSTLDDVVTARADYSQLDAAGAPVRIRLSSPVMRVRHRGAAGPGQRVEVAYCKTVRPSRPSRRGRSSWPAGTRRFRRSVPSCPPRRRRRSTTRSRCRWFTPTSSSGTGPHFRSSACSASRRPACGTPQSVSTFRSASGPTSIRPTPPNRWCCTCQKRRAGLACRFATSTMPAARSCSRRRLPLSSGAFAISWAARSAGVGSTRRPTFSALPSTAGRMVTPTSTLAGRRLLGDGRRTAVPARAPAARPDCHRQRRRRRLFLYRCSHRPRPSRGPGTARVVSGAPRIPKTLGLTDLVLLGTVAIVNVNTVPPVAGFGRATLLLWLVAFAAFFIPEAIAVMALSRRYPGEGGVYLWARRHFGDLHGFVSGWCYWTNNLFYVPVLLVYLAGVVAFAGGASTAGLVDDKWFVATIAFGWLAIITVANVRGMGVGKWLNNIGGIGSGMTVVLLVVAAMVARSQGVAATPPAVDGSVLEMASGLGVMCFAFIGIELGSTMSDEIRHPQRDVPRAIVIVGAIAIVSYCW